MVAPQWVFVRAAFGAFLALQVTCTALDVGSALVVGSDGAAPRRVSKEESARNSSPARQRTVHKVMAMYRGVGRYPAVYAEECVFEDAMVRVSGRDKVRRACVGCPRHEHASMPRSLCHRSRSGSHSVAVDVALSMHVLWWDEKQPTAPRWCWPMQICVQVMRMFEGVQVRFAPAHHVLDSLPTQRAPPGRHLIASCPPVQFIASCPPAATVCDWFDQRHSRPLVHSLPVCLPRSLLVVRCSGRCSCGWTQPIATTAPRRYICGSNTLWQAAPPSCRLRCGCVSMKAVRRRRCRRR
jgi:hypothetical protein